MNFIRSPLFVHITDINKQITEHERLMLVLKDKTASFSFKTLDVGTFFFVKEDVMKQYQMMNSLLLLMKKDAIF